MMRCGFCTERCKSCCASNDKWCIYTHSVMTCPFLAVNRCMKCYKLGHSEAHCNFDQVVANLVQTAQNKDVDVETQRLAAINYDWEMQRLNNEKAWYAMLRIATRNNKFTEASIQEAGMCTCCFKNNPSDLLFSTHNTRNCPRIACNLCRKCGFRGHYETHCGLNKEEEKETMMILDFDADDENENDHKEVVSVELSNLMDKLVIA